MMEARSLSLLREHYYLILKHNLSQTRPDPSPAVSFKSLFTLQLCLKFEVITPEISF